jgi:hypothetical protein
MYALAFLTARGHVTAYRYQPERIQERGAIQAAVAFVTALKIAPHQ